MFRRSRFSVRPNVGIVGRAVPAAAAAAQPQDVPPGNQEAADASKNVSEGNATAEVNSKSDVTSEKAAASGDTNDQNGEGSSSSAAVQRRKRFSVRPKVASGRLPSLSRIPKSPVKAVGSEAPVEASGSGSDPSTQATQTGTAAPAPGLLSPRRRRPSEGSKQPRIQAKPTGAPPAPDPQEENQQPEESSRKAEKTSSSQMKVGPPTRPPDKVPPSIPEREAIEISEKAKTLVSSKNVLSLSPSAYSLSRLLNDPSDLQRLVKAQKLRELLRQERQKEKTLKKSKSRAREYSLDPAKMTMRDLIRYLPTTNPMLSNLEDTAQENETVVPPSPRREEPPEQVQEPEAPPETTTPREEEEEEGEEDEDEAVMVPQVKVAEDGSLIIDEESLTVEVQRAKGPNVAQTRDPIFERGSTTTYSSFKKGTYSKPWSSEETDMFFLAVSMVGTDFSMICQLFTHRARSEIKNKFKKEEKINAWRIDKAFKERRKLDIEYFSKLLEKILEVQKNKKKLKSLSDKNAPKKRKRKTAGRKSARKLSDVEEEEDEDELPDSEDQGEKENEDQCDESRKENKRKTKRTVTTEEPSGKKSRSGEKSSDQDEAGIPEGAEAALPDDQTNYEISEQTEDVNTAKEAPIKPATLSRGRAPKPTLSLGRKWGKKTQPSTNPKDTASDKRGEDEEDGAPEEQADEEASPSSRANRKKVASDDISSEEEDTSVNPPKPTRSGRVPKPTKLLTYPCKEDAHSSASETSEVGSPASAAKLKPKSTPKKRRSTKPPPAQKSKKPKLVTLRASQSEFSDEEDDKQWVDEEEVEVQQVTCDRDSGAPAFIPASLHNLQPVVSEVDETLVEDVIDVLSTEHTEASEDQSYNEAAQTLLAISNVAHISQSSENTIQDQNTGISDGVNEPIQPEEELRETSETFTEVKVQTGDSADPAGNKTSDEIPEGQKTVCEIEPEMQPNPEKANEGPPQTKKGRFCKVKPKVNLGRSSRTAQLKSQSEVEGTIPKTQEGSPASLKDDAACVEVLSVEELNVKESRSVLSVFSESQTESSMHQTTRNLNSASETTDEKPKSSVTTTETAVKDLLTHDTANMEIENLPCNDSAPLLESHDRATASVLHAEDQKGKSVDATTFRAQSSRLQKVKPKPNLPLTSRRMKPETTVQSEDKDLTHCESSKDTASTSNFIDQPVASSVQKLVVPSTSPWRSARIEIPKLNLPDLLRTTRSKPQTTKEQTEKDSAPNSKTEMGQRPTSCATPKRELAATKDHRTGPELVDQVDLIVVTSDEGATENKNLSEAHSKPAVAQNVKIIDEKLTADHVPTTVASSSNVIATDSAVTKSQAGQGSDAGSAPVEEVHCHSVMPANQEVAQLESPSRLRRSRLQKPKPNLPQIGRTTRSKPQATKALNPSSSAESAIEDKNLSKVQESAPEIAVEKWTAHVQATESRCTDDVITESEVGSNVESDPSKDESAKHVEEIPTGQEEAQVASTSQLRRTRLQKVNPKSNLSQSRTVRSKPGAVQDSDALVLQVVKMPRIPTPDNTGSETQPSYSTSHPELSSPIQSTSAPPVSSQPLDLSLTRATSAEGETKDPEHGPEQNVPQQRRRFPKVKPRLGSSTRTTVTMLPSQDASKPSEINTSSSVTSEPQAPRDNKTAQRDPKGTEKDDDHLSSLKKDLTFKKSLDGTDSTSLSSDGPLKATSEGVEDETLPKSSKESTVGIETGSDKNPSNVPLVTRSASQSTNVSTRVSKPITEQIKVATSLSGVQSAKVESKADSNPACTENDLSTRSTNKAKSELAESSESTRSAPPPRRGRLIKPKPSLEGRSRPQSAQKLQKTTPAGADSGCCSSVDASQETVQGVVDKFKNQDTNRTQVSTNQNASTSAENIRSNPFHSQTMPLQVPSEPDEPFFILSLTEIPVASSAGGGGSSAERLSELPLTDTSAQPPRDSGESLVTAGGPTLSEMSTEEAVSINVQQTSGTDAAASKNLPLDNPRELKGTESTRVEPPKVPETVDGNEATIPPTKQKRPGRRAKSQVSVATAKKRQTSQPLAVKETECFSSPTKADQDPKDSRKSEDIVIDLCEERSVVGDADLEIILKEPGSSSSEQTTRRRRLTRKDQASEPPPPDKLPLKGSEAQTPSAKGRRSSAEPAASTSRAHRSTRQPKDASTTTAQHVKTRKDEASIHKPDLPDSNPPAAVSASVQSVCVESSSQPEESITVSQYFLSDIFTEVEEG